MMRIATLTGATVMGGLLLATLPVSIQWSAEKNLSISQDKAYAVVGRPATPASVAGAHRRHWTAGGPTLRGWRDLLNVKSQRLLLGDLGPLRHAGTIAALQRGRQTDPFKGKAA